VRWSDIQDIAIALCEADPHTDPYGINFVELRDKVMALDGFEDASSSCGEKILEAIQSAWADERD